MSQNSRELSHTWTTSRQFVEQEAIVLVTVINEIYPGKEIYKLLSYDVASESVIEPCVKNDNQQVD